MIPYENIQKNDKATLDDSDIDILSHELGKIEKAMKAIDTISQTLVMIAHARGSQESILSLPNGVLINNFVSDDRVIIGLASSLDLLSGAVSESEDYISTTIESRIRDNREKKEARP